MIEYVAETGSTNADLITRSASETLPEGYWLVADRQKSGRGRRGSAWEDGSGNFMGSTIVQLQDTDPAPASLSFVAALALREAIGQCIDGRHVLQLKWPNDLVLDRCKVSGILLERAGNTIVVGIGVNIVSAPKLPDRPTIALHDAGAKVSRDEFATLLQDSFAQELKAWRFGHAQGFGIVGVLNNFMFSSVHQLGAMTTVHDLDGNVISGTFAGLEEEDGALCLRQPDGSERVLRAGEVILGRS
ncbi:MAG: biotin--[acetyl-CoA-carboxylase] ligase [Pseudomonadota bacterium]